MLRRLLRTLPLLLVLHACLLEAESFRNPKLITTASDPQGAATADLNGDGHLDLVFTTGPGFTGQTLHVLLGHGDGTFSPQPDVTLPQYLCGCAINIEDVTHDGRPDLVLGGGGRGDGTGPVDALIAVLPGNGDGTFGDAILSNVPVNSNNPGTATLKGIADVNGDGALDLIIADPYDAAILVLLGDNSGNFTLGSRLTDFDYPTVIYAADLNGDGHIDFVANGEVGSPSSVYLGRGDGTFAAPVFYSPGGGASADLVADVNGDGHPDLVSVLYTGQVQARLGNADGSFGALQPLGTAPPQGTSAQFRIIDVADYNADGHPDIALLSPSGVSVLPSTGTLTFGLPVASLSGGGSLVMPVAGDWNEDGHRDVAMVVEGGIALLLGKGDGSFPSGDLYDLGHSPGSSAVADFNGDHRPDIAVLVSATQPRLLLGTGTGAFNLAPDPNTSYGPGTGYSSLTAADFNGDGKADLAAPNGIYFGNGDGTFLAPLSVPDQTTSVADFNNDGRADTVNVSYPGSGSILVELGQANGTFVEKSTQLRNPTNAALRVIGDFNGDGKQDIILSDDAGDEVWLGNGDGTFTYGSTLNVAPSGPFGYQAANGGAIADIDGDGKADLVLTSNTLDTPMVGVFWGNGDGTFAAPTIFTPSHVYGNIVLADVNGDSHPDLVLSDSFGIAVVEYQGSRSFGQEDHYVAGNDLGQLSLADVNGDGAPDIIAVDTSGTTVAVLLNQPNGTPPGGVHVQLSLSLAPQPVSAGQPFTATLSLSPAAGSPAPTGTVDFLVDGVLYASERVANGSAAVSVTSALAPGPHAVQAVYSGDSNYGSSSVTVNETVSHPVYSTTTVLTPTPSEALPGQVVRLIAHVASSAPATLSAGQVSFYDGSTALGVASLDVFGNAEFATNLLTAGTHSLTAVYSGYTDVNIYQPSTSAPASLVIAAVATATTLSATPAAPTVGSVVTLTAVVASLSAPFGGVSFYDGSTLLGTASLVPASSTTAQASWSTSSLGAGPHALTATFHANATWGSSSGAASATLTPAAASQHPTLTHLVFLGGALQATLLDGGGNALASSAGYVTFLDSGQILGRVPLANGSSRLAFSPAPGMHAVSASFSGSSGLAPSTSPVLSQGIGSGADFSLTAAEVAITLPVSGSASIALQVSAPGSQSTALTCASGVPSGYACTFSPAPVRGSGTATLTLSPLTATRLPTGGFIGLVASFAGLGWLGARRRSMRSPALAAVGLFLAALSLNGCGGTQAPAPLATSLVIQGASAAGAESVLHQVQILVRTLR